MRRALVVLAALLGLVAVVVTPASGPVYLGHATSGSMAPAIDAGDGYVVVPAGEVEAGDVVVFRSPERGSFVTHRVVGETEGGFLTKGDANDETDQAVGLPPVPRSAIEGRVLAAGGGPVVLPGLGTLVLAIQAHRLLALALVAGLAVVVGVRDRKRRDPRDRTVLRVGHVVPPLLAGAAVLGVAVILLASSSHVVAIEGGDGSGGTATVTIQSDPGPMTHLVVGAEGATIEGRSMEDGRLSVRLAVPPSAVDSGKRLLIHPYPRTLPDRVIEALHAVHPVVAAVAAVSAILGPLGVTYALAVDGHQPLRSPVRRRGGQ